MDMHGWLEDIKKAKTKKAIPVLSYPGVQLIGTTVDKLVHSGRLQADCMKAIADRFDTGASVSLMDLSVEAEAFGSPVRFSQDEVPTVTGAVADTEEDAANLRVPQVGEGRTGEYVKTIELASREITDRPVLAGSIGPFSLAGRLMDMTEIMVKCYTDPEVVHAVLEKATLFLIEYNKAFRAAGADGIVMAEPAAGILSPELMAEFSAPYVKRIIEAVQTTEFLVVYHNCGNTIPLIGPILSAGPKAVHFGNAIDISQMLPLVPSDIVVMGNVDPVSGFRAGTPESIRSRTMEILNQCAKYKNFVISSGCDIPPLAPIANVRAFFDAVDEFYR